MTERAIDRCRDTWHAAGLNWRDQGEDRASAQAPGHSAADGSVSFKQIDGMVLVNSFSDQKPDVLAAVGLTEADLFDEPKTGSHYDYPDGRRVHRSPTKQFRQSGNTKGRSLFRVAFGDAETVYVTEGEKDCLAIESVGAAATCPAMGAGKAHLFDWTPLLGKTVVVVADTDEPGYKHAAQVVGLLDGIATSSEVVTAAVGKDAADHIAAGKGLDEFVAVPVDTSEVSADEDDEDKPQRRSMAARIVDLARADYQLGVTDTDDPFGVTAEHPHIALMLRGGRTGMRAELSRRIFAETNTVASQQALADAGMVLEGFAAQQEPQRVYLRVAELAGVVYLDTGNANGDVIRIGGGVWSIAPTAPVLFRRTKLTGELPIPRRGNGGSKLWDFVGIDKADRPILLAVLVAALIQVDVPHVVLLLLAEQGSAKSTVTRLLVGLIDPSAVPLRQPPRDPDGWTTAASASWLVALDNLSGDIDGWFSDCLCRASTGDGSVKRALYTDSDVAVVSFRRVVIGNGVDVAPVRGDLAERVATVRLPRIASRRAESEFEAEWAAARPEVFAALLDLAAKVHALLPMIAVDDLPRMADFAKVLAAVDQVMHTDGLARYREQARNSARDTLDVPFIAELVGAGQEFTDTTSKALLALLTPTSTDWRAPKGWPTSPRAVTGLLTRHAPALRAQGWQIDNDDGRNTENRVRWTITRPRARGPETGGNGDSSTSSTSSPQVNDGDRDELGDDSAGRRVSAITRLDTDDSSISSPATHLTSDDRATSQTSNENTPSLVLVPPGGLTATSPGQTDRVQKALAIARSGSFSPPNGPGRCAECGCHIELQGHRDDCQAGAR